MRIREEVDSNSYRRVIPLSHETADIVDKVLYEMSDGIWRTSYYMPEYWNFCEVVGNDLVIDNIEGTIRNGKFTKLPNRFYTMSDAEVKKWFAKMIKKIIDIEATKGFHKRIDNSQDYSFNADNATVSKYLTGYHSKYDITIGDAYRAYQELLK